MDKDSIEYLERISERMADYDDARMKVLEFIVENQIEDVEVSQDLLIMGILWKAKQRGEVIDEQELDIFLGTDDDDYDYEGEVLRSLELDEEVENLDFEELMYWVLENTQC